VAKLWLIAKKFLKCKDGMELYYHHAESGRACTLHAAMGHKNVLC